MAGKNTSAISGALSGATTGATLSDFSNLLTAYINGEISIIYQILNIKNNKIYIGQTTDLKQRIRKHKKELKNGTHPNSDLLGDYNIYKASSFVFSILEICDKNNADGLESSYIEKHKTHISDYGYNKTYGGLTGKHTQETVLKITGKNNPMYNKTPWNKGGKNLQAAWNKGLKTGHSHNRKAVIGVNLKTSEIREFVSVTEAATYINTQSTNVSNVCNGKRYKSYKGWKFSYKEVTNG